MKLLTLTSFLSLNLITGVNYCYSEMESNASKKVKSPSLVKRMPPIPSFIPKRMPKPSLPSATPPFVNLPSAFIKRMPKPFKTSVRWSDFKYNSPEEKEFWDSVPDWTEVNHLPKGHPGIFFKEGNQSIMDFVKHPMFKNHNNLKPRFSKEGVSMIEEGGITDGYTGYSKEMGSICPNCYKGCYAYSEPRYHGNYIQKYTGSGSVGSFLLQNKKHENHWVRILNEFKNGYLQRTKVWYKDGTVRLDSNKNTEPMNLKGEIIRLNQLTDFYDTGEKAAERKYVKGFLESYTSWQKNGFKLEEGNFKKVLIPSSTEPYISWIRYHSNGQKSSERNYVNGEIEGLSVSWYSNGQKKTETLYRDGRKESIKQWKENGEKCPKTKYAMGDGIIATYTDSGLINRIESYIGYKIEKKISYIYHTRVIKRPHVPSVREVITYNGNYQKNGAYTRYHHSGVKAEEGKFVDGMKQGLWFEWTDEKQEKSGQKFIDGKPSGPEINYDKSGKKKSELYRETRLKIFFNEDGSEISRSVLPPPHPPRVFPRPKNISSRTVTRPKIRPLKISTTETSSKIDLNSQKITEAKKMTEKREKWIVDEKKRRVGEFLDQSQEGFTNGNVTSFSHLKNKNWSSFKAGKKGVLSTIELAWSTPPHESHFSGLYGSSMKGFIKEEDDENGTIVANWSISKDDLMMQFAGLKRAEQNWVIINVISNSQLQLGKTYYIVCENISEEKEWFGNFSFSDKNSYQDGRFWYNQNHDLMFRTYVKPAE